MENNFNNSEITFDDILLVPQYSDIRSRQEIDLTTYFAPGVEKKLPIMSAPMDTVTEHEMALAMDSVGGVGIIHRFISIEKQCKEVDLFFEKGGTFVVGTIGTMGDFLERATELVKHKVSGLCIDVAHGHHISVKETLKLLKVKFPTVPVIAGNVATFQGAKDLALWGADLIKVGVGNGSACSTRGNTGHGVPQLSALIQCVRIKDEHPNVGIVADGGIRQAGDIAKALAFGADFCMLGGMLSGTRESPGEIHKEYMGDLRTFKTYRGMASDEAQLEWKGSVNSKEGISVYVPYKGSVLPILKDIETNLKSALSYSGARNLLDFQVRAQFVRQTNSGIGESFTHILHNGGIKK